MIKRKLLPNLVIKTSKNTSLFNNPKPSHYHQAGSSSVHYQPPHNLNQTLSAQKHPLSSLNHIEVKMQLKLKTQQSLNSQPTLNHHQLFHNNLDPQKQPYHNYNHDFKSQNLNQKIAPYFFKIHGGFKILQNQDQLKKKMLQAQIHQANQNQNQRTISQKKKISKQLTHSSSNKLEPSLENSQYNTARFSAITSTKKTDSNKKFYTQTSEIQNTQSLLQDRKRSLTLKGKEGQYSFEHFNSGQIFESIAELNEKKILSNPDSNQYRITAYGTYVNNVSGSKALSKKIIQNRIYEEFKQEYNSFLKKSLPPSFGENGNKSCIYEQYVQNRKAQSLKKIQPKVFTRPLPEKSHKAEFIFSNSIDAISSTNFQAQKVYHTAVRTQEQEVIKRTAVGLLKQSSTQTSRMISEMNSKMNTLRHGQTLQDKLKLKKLAKLEFMQKAKKMKKNVLKSSKQNKEKQLLSKRKSSLSGYSSSKDNKISEEEMQRLKQKSELILGKQFELSNPVINPQQHNRKYGKMMEKSVENITQLNEYETKHLEHIDSLLKKQVSTLRKSRKNLDSSPWKIPIKINKKASLN